jgi:hypothetical protein
MAWLGRGSDRGSLGCWQRRPSMRSMRQPAHTPSRSTQLTSHPHTPIPLSDTEGKLSVPRMQEIALARAAAAAPPGAPPPPALEEAALGALDRLLIIKAGTLDALRAALAALEAQVAQRGVRLVVLDSVAALLRAELGGGREQVPGAARGAKGGEGECMSCRGARCVQGRRGASAETPCCCRGLPSHVGRPLTSPPPSRCSSAASSSAARRRRSRRSPRATASQWSSPTRWARAPGSPCLLFSDQGPASCAAVATGRE